MCYKIHLLLVKYEITETVVNKLFPTSSDKFSVAKLTFFCTTPNYKMCQNIDHVIFIFLEYYCQSKSIKMIKNWLLLLALSFVRKKMCQSQQTDVHIITVIITVGLKHCLSHECI